MNNMSLRNEKQYEKEHFVEHRDKQMNIQEHGPSTLLMHIVELSTNLSWKDHITIISESVGKKLNILAKLKNLLDRETLTII